jgi:hypothetical protein
MSDLKSLVTFDQAQEWPEADEIPAEALVLIEVNKQVYKVPASRLAAAPDPTP